MLTDKRIEATGYKQHAAVHSKDLLKTLELWTNVQKITVDSAGPLTEINCTNNSKFRYFLPRTIYS